MGEVFRFGSGERIDPKEVAPAPVAREEEMSTFERQTLKIQRAFPGLDTEAFWRMQSLVPAFAMRLRDSAYDRLRELRAEISAATDANLIVSVNRATQEDWERDPLRYETIGREVIARAHKKAAGRERGV